MAQTHWREARIKEPGVAPADSQNDTRPRGDSLRQHQMEGDFMALAEREFATNLGKLIKDVDAAHKKFLHLLLQACLSA